MAITVPAILILIAIGLSGFGCIYVMLHTLVHLKTMQRHKLFPLSLLAADLVFIAQEAAQTLSATLHITYSPGSCRFLAILRTYAIDAHALAFMCMSAIAFYYFLSAKRPRKGNMIITMILFVIPFAVPIITLFTANFNQRDAYLCALTYTQDKKSTIPFILFSFIVSTILVIPVPFIHGIRRMPSLDPFSPFPTHLLIYAIQVAMFVVLVLVYTNDTPSMVLFTIQEVLLSIGGFLDSTVFWNYIVKPHTMTDLYPGTEIFGTDDAFATELDPFEGGKAPPNPVEYAFGARNPNAVQTPETFTKRADSHPAAFQPLRNVDGDEELSHTPMGTSSRYYDDDVETQSRIEYDIDGKDSLDGAMRASYISVSSQQMEGRDYQRFGSPPPLQTGHEEFEPYGSPYPMSPPVPPPHRYGSPGPMSPPIHEQSHSSHSHDASFSGGVERVASPSGRVRGPRPMSPRPPN